MEDYILHDSAGNEIKEWYAIARYLQAMDGEMDPAYSQPDGRKVVYSSWNPISLLRSPNWVTLVVLAVALVLLIVLILIIRAVVYRVRGGRRGGGSRGYRAYRGRR